MENNKIHVEVKGAPLIKFQSLDKIEKLQKGLVYAKTLEYYRQREIDTGDTEVGDSFEGKIHVNEAYIHIVDGETIALKDELINTKHSDDYVFCMFGIYHFMNEFQFTDKQKDKMRSFGSHALLITDSDEFIRRVKLAAKGKYEVYFDAVNYYPPNEDSGNMLLSLVGNMWKVAFWKRDMYKYQQEARFLFVSNEHNVDHIELDIGDISDISIIVTAEQVLSGEVKKQ